MFETFHDKILEKIQEGAYLIMNLYAKKMSLHNNRLILMDSYVGEFSSLENLENRNYF